MTSQRQVDANQANAAKSTGPKTASGKAASARNALKHGITASRLLTTDEDAEEFRAFVDALRDDLAPVGAVESELVDGIISACWRLRRVDHLETSLIKKGLLQAREKAARASASEIEMGAIIAMPDIDERGRRQAADWRLKAREITAEAALETAGTALSANNSALILTARYRTAAENAFLRLLHELERRQARRAGKAIAPPEVVDISVAVSANGARSTNDGESSVELLSEPTSAVELGLRNEPISSDGAGI